MIPDFGFYNMDCMEGMKQFPDKYFELAIVDPPYGDGGAHGSDKTRAGSAERSTVIDHLHSSQRKREREGRTNRRNVGEQVRQKNHYVGHSPETGIFRRAVSCLTEPDYMGGQLFLLTADKMLSRVEKAHS